MSEECKRCGMVNFVDQVGALTKVFHCEIIYIGKKVSVCFFCLNEIRQKNINIFDDDLIGKLS